LKLPIYYIDAFTENVFQGNPAAVVVVKENLADETMQAIAFEKHFL
jgi:PhzF family phenazine biosynthesis protein